MANDYATAKDILSDAQDIVPLMPSQSNRGLHVYAVKPSISAQRQLFNESVADEAEKNILAFQGHWKFNKQKGITGSSTYLALRFEKKALRPRGMWLPGLLEAKILEYKGKLKNDGFYRDYSTVVCRLKVYIMADIDKKRSEEFIAQAKESGLELPLILQFSAMDYALDKRKPYGLFVSILQSPEGIIKGTEATQELSKQELSEFHWKKWSGVNRLSRYHERWGVIFGNNLSTSGDDGRVDWFCGEATEQDLRETYNPLLERRDGKNMKKRKKGL